MGPSPWPSWTSSGSGYMTSDVFSFSHPICEGNWIWNAVEFFWFDRWRVQIFFVGFCFHFTQGKRKSQKDSHLRRHGLSTKSHRVAPFWTAPHKPTVKPFKCFKHHPRPCAGAELTPGISRLSCHPSISQRNAMLRTPIPRYEPASASELYAK